MPVERRREINSTLQRRTDDDNDRFSSRDEEALNMHQRTCLVNSTEDGGLDQDDVHS